MAASDSVAQGFYVKAAASSGTEHARISRHTFDRIMTLCRGAADVVASALSIWGVGCHRCADSRSRCRSVGATGVACRESKRRRSSCASPERSTSLIRTMHASYERVPLKRQFAFR